MPHRGSESGHHMHIVPLSEQNREAKDSTRHKKRKSDYPPVKETVENPYSSAGRRKARIEMGREDGKKTSG